MQRTRPPRFSRASRAVRCTKRILTGRVCVALVFLCEDTPLRDSFVSCPRRSNRLDVDLDYPE